MAYNQWEVWDDYFGKGVERDKDVCGATIVRAAYRDRKSQYGWDVDHILPKKHGGKDDPDNLRPLHLKNNAAKGDKREGQWNCAKSS